MIQANRPELTSWIEVPSNHHFPIQNLPFGVFITPHDSVTCGSRIGDMAIDLSALHQLGYFKELELPEDVFLQDTLNDFISLGRTKTRALRNRLSQLFAFGNSELQNNQSHLEHVLYPIAEVQMLLPVFIQDYTDFYSSREHATNVGTMFRDPNNALLPNWLHLPVAYHGRSSTIVPSGEPVHRPLGQRKTPQMENPVFGPSTKVDFELEVAFITGDGKPMGQRISTSEAEDYIFGMVLFNDWSARDIQTWEYQPLGPFLAKNFGSSMSPWVVTLDALDPFRTKTPTQSPEVLDYLKFSGEKSFDIQLEVSIQPEGEQETVVCSSNHKFLYWNISQQLAHHTVNGCRINAGDLMASGTISGPTANSYGSMLELTWNGTKPVLLANGTERNFIEDNDTVIIRGICKGPYTIGFGEVSSKLLPAVPLE